MDDPAVWVNPVDPSRSLLIGNDKGGALETYDVAGNRVQRLQLGDQFWGNVDIRQRVTIGGVTRDLVGVTQGSVRFYAIDPSSRLLSAVTEGNRPIGTSGEGFCMYRSPTSNKVYGVTITIAGLVRQFELVDADSDGALESRTVREFSVGSEAEGCVADDRTGALYISEENRALWRYGAEPGAGSTREAVDVLDPAGGQLVNDVEGVTVVDQAGGGGGYLIVSSQNAADPNASFFNVYRRGAGNEWVANFRVTNGASSDDCDRTDGITAVAADLGPRFPQGIFVCQDNNNDAPGGVGNQNLKMVRLEKVLALDNGTQPPSTRSIAFAGRSTANTNSTQFAVPVPPGTRPGGSLVLFVSDSGVALSGPGAGWTQVGRTTDGTHGTTVYSRVATAADTGSTVRLTSGTLTKAALTLAAYTGTDATDPVAAVAGVPEPGASAAHTTPALANPVPGALRVSFWSDRSSGTTAWTAPSGEITRAVTAGTGGGRITTLLTDPAVPLAGTGTTGRLTATANGAADKATSWTLLLRPAG